MAEADRSRTFPRDEGTGEKKPSDPVTRIGSRETLPLVGAKSVINFVLLVKLFLVVDSFVYSVSFWVMERKLHASRRRSDRVTVD